MEKRLFGTLSSGEEVYIYRIIDGESSAEITEFGATIVSLRPFGNVDVVSGFDTLDGYLVDKTTHGSIVGRVANRIANAEFRINGTVYHVSDNENGNCLHSGIGFQYRLWKVTSLEENSITLSYTSPDGEEGFPSELYVEVTYTLKDSALIISYKAVPKGITPINLTNHVYFNLDGLGNDIKDHTAQIWADRYTEVDDKSIPNGNRPSVEGTPFDLRKPTRIGTHFSRSFDGYDRNMILSPKIFKEFNGQNIGLAAVIENQDTILKMYTDQPGFQFYTGGFLGKGPDFKNGTPQIRFAALCLEAQAEPDSVNHGIGIYKEGEEYHQLTAYEFVRK